MLSVAVSRTRFQRHLGGGGAGCAVEGELRGCRVRPAVGGLEAGRDGGSGVLVGPLSVRPKNWMAAAAMPLAGRLCPALWMRYASTFTVPVESA
jgi:hypothetical protein